MRIGSWNVTLQSPIRFRLLPSLYTWGITNRTDDGYWLIRADYDAVEYEVVRQDCLMLQRRYGEGMLMTRASSHHRYKDDVEVGSFHIIGFTKHSLKETRTMTEELRCDEHFKHNSGYQLRVKVIRIGPKLDIRNGFVETRHATMLREIFPADTVLRMHRGTAKLLEMFDNLKPGTLTGKLCNDDGSGPEDVELIRYVTR